MISQSEAPATKEIEVHKHQRGISDFSGAMGKTGLTGVTRSSLNPEKRIPKKKSI